MSGEDKAREWIVPGKNRRLVKPRGEDRRLKFTRTRQARFCEHLAATCNVTASAETVEVSLSAVYRRRMRDPDFREAWNVALEQGYARLEAALLARAMRGEGRIAVSGDLVVEGPAAPDEVDFDKGLHLLRHHQRGPVGRAQGFGAQPRRVPVEEVAAKLVRKLKALGVKVEEDSA